MLLARRATLLAVTHALLDMTYKRTQMDCQNKPIQAHGFLGVSRKPMHGLEVYPHLHNRSKCIGTHEGRLALSHDCASSSADEPIPSFATIAPSRMVLFKKQSTQLILQFQRRTTSRLLQGIQESHPGILGTQPHPPLGHTHQAADAGKIAAMALPQSTADVLPQSVNVLGATNHIQDLAIRQGHCLRHGVPRQQPFAVLVLLLLVDDPRVHAAVHLKGVRLGRVSMQNDLATFHIPLGQRFPHLPQKWARARSTSRSAPGWQFLKDEGVREATPEQANVLAPLDWLLDVGGWPHGSEWQFTLQPVRQCARESCTAGDTGARQI